MKTALLIPGKYVCGDKKGYKFWEWETPSGRELSPEYDTRAEALAHRPNPAMYVCRNDGYRKI